MFLLVHRTQNIRRNQIWMSITLFTNFQSLSICKWPRKVNSHKNIAQKLEVLKTFWELQCEFLDILYLFMISHANRSWENAKTHKLDKHDEQPISCAEGENSTKN